ADAHHRSARTGRVPGQRRRPEHARLLRGLRREGRGCALPPRRRAREDLVAAPARGERGRCRISEQAAGRALDWRLRDVARARHARSPLFGASRAIGSDLRYTGAAPRAGSIDPAPALVSQRYAPTFFGMGVRLQVVLPVQVCTRDSRPAPPPPIDPRGASTEWAVTPLESIHV